MSGVRVAVFSPSQEEPDIRVIGSNGRVSLTDLEVMVGGRLDIGVSRPLQFAVGEYSFGSGLNRAAAQRLGREVHGVCVVWGVGPGGDDEDYPGEGS